MIQRTRFKLIIYLIFLIFLLGLLLWWFSIGRAQGRDYERLADLKQIQAEFLIYFSRFNTYQVSDCQLQQPIHFCSGEDNRGLLNIINIVDPLNQPPYQYLVSDLTDDDFIIDFAFERGVGGLSAGNYFLTKNGIGQP